MPINRGAVGAIAGYFKDQRKRREEAYKSDQEFQQRLQAAGIAAGRLEPIISGGRITGVQPTVAFDPSTLSPGQTYSQRVSGGTLTSRGAPAPRPLRETDPLVQLQRETAAQNALQEIEQRNALAPVLAMSEREKAFPRPQAGFIGGYTENAPNLLQKVFGARQRPQAPAVPTVDTSTYRNRLSTLQGQGARLGVSSFAPTTGADEAEVGDLMSGIRQGLIRTRDDAEQIIEAAGLDPDDPAFQDILNQLP